MVRLYKDIGLEANREDAILESGRFARSRNTTGSDVNVLKNGYKLSLAVQVKDQRSPSVWKANEEAERVGKQRGHLPVSHVKRTQQVAFAVSERLVVMPEEAWLALIEQLVERGIVMSVIDDAAYTYSTK